MSLPYLLSYQISAIPNAKYRILVYIKIAAKCLGIILKPCVVQHLLCTLRPRTKAPFYEVSSRVMSQYLSNRMLCSSCHGLSALKLVKV